MSQPRTKTSGTVLILVLWALSFLTVIAVNLAVIVRQKISLVAAVERRAETRQMARTGVQLALTVLHRDKLLTGDGAGVMRKQLWHNNPQALCQVPVGRGHVDVVYEAVGFEKTEVKDFCGFVDEERKININRADRAILVGLIKEVLGIEEDKAGEMAGAILDWRELGETDIEGFSNDQDYEDLEYPYPEKKADFERMEELALIKGVNTEMYHVLKNYLTVYGTGRVNLNTAAPPVLLALGLRPEVVVTVVAVRYGPDDREATTDDVFFENIDDFLTIVGQFMPLTQMDTAVVRGLESRGLIGTGSRNFQIRSKGQLVDGQVRAVVDCVVDSATDKILSWQERWES